MTDVSATETPVAPAIPTVQPLRTAPADCRGRGVNSRRIATVTPNGDRAIASA
jgi:hypothetical protein